MRDWVRQRRASAAIIALSVLGGIAAALIVPSVIVWIPYDYAVYVRGARMVRAGLDPHALLPYWYPLPIVLFTTFPWSYLPDRFAWAFAFIPLGLLHLRYGKRAAITWLMFPLMINVAYAQAEGWLLLPIFWLLENSRVNSALGALAMTFKPAYGMFLIPYDFYLWVREQRWRDLGLFFGLGGAMMLAAFIIDPQWFQHWWGSILVRGNNPELIERNMTVWAFLARGGVWLGVLAIFLLVLGALVYPALHASELRPGVLLAFSLFFFPNGLNPVSSMMVLPLAQTTREILALVVSSWIAVLLDIAVGGFGGVYLVPVLAALAIQARRAQRSQAAR